MRRRAEARNTTHELMAFSGHKTLAEVQRYTEAANTKRLADSGAAKMREAQAAAPKRITDQSGTATNHQQPAADEVGRMRNASYTNTKA